MTSEANTSCLREREMRARGTGDGVFANDNCRRLNDNYEPRQMDITNLAMTGRSSCRRPAILVDVDHPSNRNMEVRAATAARVSLCMLASDLPLDPQSATSPGLTDAPSEARASLSLLPWNQGHGGTRPRRVSREPLHPRVCSDLPLEIAERDDPVPHGRTVEGASQAVSAPHRTGTWRYAPQRGLA